MAGKRLTSELLGSFLASVDRNIGRGLRLSDSRLAENRKSQAPVSILCGFLRDEIIT